MAAKRKTVRRKPGGATRPASEHGRRPDVILDVDYERGLLFLVLRNIGDDLACQISVGFSPKLSGLAGDRIVSDASIFRNLAYLPPGKSIRVFLDAAPSLFARNRENSFRARVQYGNRAGDEYAETFAHALDVYRDLPEETGSSGSA